MRAHLVQFDIAWEDKPVNHARIRDLLAGVRIDRGDLVVLPEMFDTGFSINTEKTHDADGLSVGFLRALASEYGAFVTGSVTVLEGPGGLARNRSLSIAPDGSTAASYDKIHPFSLGREHERFEAGRTTSSFAWKAAQGELCVFPTVCYDLRFPELFRAGTLRGAEAYTVIANWPDTRIEHWRTLLRARAIENLAYVFAVNRTGSDPHLSYNGRSAVIAPNGEVLEEIGDEERVASVQIEPDRVRDWRAGFPALIDRSTALTPDTNALPKHTGP